MSELVMIEPHRLELADGVPVLEIWLGGTPRGLVILVSDANAPEGEVVEAMNNLAAEGFESLALWAGPGVATLGEARARARGWKAEQTGVVGIGEGGAIALGMARQRELGAVVSISPALDDEAVADIVVSPVLRTPLLTLFGASDTSVPASAHARLRDAFDAGSDVFSRVVTYSGVGADFYRRSEDGVAFAASYDGWQRTLEWLLARVASRLTPLAEAWREKHPV